MRARRHIALTGPPAAGKTEVAAMLEAAGYRSVDVGGVLEQRLRGSGIEAPTRAHIGPMFVDRFGIDGVYDAVIAVIKEDESVVLDAIRAASTVQKLRRWDDDLVVLHVDAPDGLRLRRLHERIVDWDDPTAAEAAYAALNTDAAWCEHHADAVIRNDGSAASLRRKVEQMLAAER